MIFLKPKFWDRNKISFILIFLFPISLIIKFINLIKPYVIKTHTYSIPVICVGNIYLGGTGKTPSCIKILSILKNLNMNPVFIRKKYNAYNDEVMLQEQHGLVFQDKKRVKAINDALNNKANVAILDDGFQDLSIEKKLSIICFNENRWVGNGFTVPAGPLREGLSSLNRAHCVFINGKKNEKIETEIFKHNKKIKIFYTRYKPLNLLEFENKKIIAFAGIGDPQNFFDLLTNNRLNIIDKIKFPDHYNYSEKDLKNLINKSEINNAILLTTEKDYLRIKSINKKIFKYLKIELEIDNQNKFVEELKKII